MKVPVVTVEEKFGTGKTILLQKFKELLSSADKFKMRVEHDTISEFQSLCGNKLINLLEHFFRIQWQIPSSLRIIYCMHTKGHWKD